MHAPVKRVCPEKWRGPSSEGAKLGTDGRGSGSRKEWKRRKDEERNLQIAQIAAKEATAGPADKNFPCVHCSERFTSKTRLFAHLRAGGACSKLSGDVGLPTITKKEKVVVLMGYIADRFQSREGVEYITQHGCIGEVGADTTDTKYRPGSLEHALFSALDLVRGAKVDDGKERYSEMGRAPKFSRASRCDKGMHAVTNYLSFLTEQLPHGLKPQRFVDQLNDALRGITGNDVTVFARVAVQADFHAKISCDRKQYSVLIPMKTLLPEGQEIGKGWKLLWASEHSEGGKSAKSQGEFTQGSLSKWRFSKRVFGEELEKERAEGRCDLKEGFAVVHKGGAASGGKGGVRVMHVGGGRTLVYREIEGGGLVLPKAVSIEWLQQDLHVAAAESETEGGVAEDLASSGGHHTAVRVIICVNGSFFASRACFFFLGQSRWYGTMETFGSERVREYYSTDGREEGRPQFLLKVAVPFDTKDDRKEKKLCDWMPFDPLTYNISPPSERIGLSSNCTMMKIGFLIETHGRQTGGVAMHDLKIYGCDGTEAGAEGKTEGHLGPSHAAFDPCTAVQRVGFYMRIKHWIRKFHGRHLFHNFCNGVSATEQRSHRRVHRLVLQGVLVLDSHEFLQIGIDAQKFLFQHVQKMVGVLIAVARGLVPPSYIDLALDASAFVHTPVAPNKAFFLAECAYDKYEAVTNTQLRPRTCHYRKGFSSRGQHEAVKRYAQKVYAHIMQAEIEGGPGSILHWVQEVLPSESLRMLRDMQVHHVRHSKEGDDGTKPLSPEVSSLLLRYGVAVSEHVALIRELMPLIAVSQADRCK